MGRHSPLPSDPIAKAAEKRRRFKAYQKEWKRRRAAEDREKSVSKTKHRRALLAEARHAALDLCLTVDHMSNEQLRRALLTVQGWA
jgi:hypothetical protein